VIRKDCRLNWKENNPRKGTSATSDRIILLISGNMQYKTAAKSEYEYVGESPKTVDIHREILFFTWVSL
jgi:hypothetical protein